MSPPALTMLHVEIAKLEPQPGDLLVFRYTALHSAVDRHYFAQHLEACLPSGVAAVILNPDMELTLVRRGMSCDESFPPEGLLL